MRDMRKGRPITKKLEEKMLSLRTNQEVPLRKGAALGERDELDEEGYG